MFATALRTLFAAISVAALVGGCGPTVTALGDAGDGDETQLPDTSGSDAQDTGTQADLGADAWSDTVSADTGADVAGDTADTAADTSVDTQTDTDPGCTEPLGAACNPIPVSPLPFVDTRDTRSAPASAWDTYGCSTANEAGGEFVYRLDVLERGVVAVSVDDVAGDAVDIDVHLLSSLDPASCLARANVSFDQLVEPGTYYLVADTWVNADGTALAGAYTLTVSFVSASSSCAVAAQDLRMFWTSCDPSIDCYAAGGEVFLRTPATGPVVKEAHLVTVLDDFGGGWPTSFTDGIQAHYAASQAATGFVANRTEPWAPAGEGGSEYGQGSTGTPLPVDAEAWYVNMYWRDRPARGARMIIRNPANGKAAVAAAGYETGPGSNTAIGGVVEELHLYLGTSHRDVLELGFAVDQTLPYGPIVCP